MNTHSREADCRMELMAAAAIRAGVSDNGILNRILDCVSTDEAYAVMQKEGIEKKCFERIMERIAFYLNARASDMQIECIVYSNRYGLLGKTPGADGLLKEIREVDIK